MIETQLAQIAASLPAVESGKIPGQPESPVENASMVSTGRGNCNTQFTKGHKPSNHIRARGSGHRLCVDVYDLLLESVSVA